jgi:protein-S-isoprenylcysteine O-methyltransferase Ste14
MTDRRLLRTVVVRFTAGFAVILAVLLGVAGTRAWAEAWIWTGLMGACMLRFAAWAFPNAPEVLARRMRTHEEDPRQRVIVALGGLFAVGFFVLPALDRRFGWSEVPAWGVAIADVVVLGGYLLFTRVMQVNAWAGRTIRVDDGQHVIDTGPYGVVRHPMYVSSALIYLATPLALGSVWGVIPAIAATGILIPRILFEERTLDSDLPGYAAYRAKVRWRLVPGLW